MKFTVAGDITIDEVVTSMVHDSVSIEICMRVCLIIITNCYNSHSQL